MSDQSLAELRDGRAFGLLRFPFSQVLAEPV